VSYIVHILSKCRIRNYSGADTLRRWKREAGRYKIKEERMKIDEEGKRSSVVKEKGINQSVESIFSG